MIKERDVIYARSHRDVLALEHLLAADGMRCMASWHLNDEHLHAYSDPRECTPLDAAIHQHMDECICSKKVYRYKKNIYIDTPQAVAEAAAKLAQAAEEDDDDDDEEEESDDEANLAQASESESAVLLSTISSICVVV